MAKEYSDKDILKFALQNAALHEGKAELQAVLKKIISEHPEARGNIKEILRDIQKVVLEVNKLSHEQQLARLRELAPELLEKQAREEHKPSLPELPNVHGLVILRYAPYPSGPLHIGNIYPAIINDEYRKRYNGKLLLVMDDTIGSEEKMVIKEAYDLILEGLKWMDIEFETPVIYKSDRLEIYYEYAEQIIGKNKAYVCFCSVEELRENRLNGIECACRNKSAQENLKEWNNMLLGEYKEGKAVLRIKTSMQHENPAFRDRVLFRIKNKEHPRIGNKYNVWPLLEFSWAIDDYLLGITHIIRGKDLMIETEMEKYIWSIFGWDKKEIIHTGLLHIEGTKLSKSKSQKEIKEGKYTGWDDPRTWSMQSLMRRGIQKESIRKFCLGFGLTRHEVAAPIEILYSENRRMLDSVNRYFFISEPVKIRIENTQEVTVAIPLHPTLEKGDRILSSGKEFYIESRDYQRIKKGGIFRLMHLFNFKFDKKFKFVSKELDDKLKAAPIHWLPADNENEVVKTSVLTGEGKFLHGLAESSIKTLKSGDIVQFERFGFCRLDSIIDNSFKFWFSHK